MKKRYIAYSVLVGSLLACSSSKKATKTIAEEKQNVENAFETLNEGGLDRSIRPKASEAKELTIGNFESFTLENGLKVFVIENHKLPTLSYSLSVDVDPIYEGKNAGYTSLVGPLMEAGTKTKTKEQLDEEVDFMGANIGASASGVYAGGLSKYKGEMMNILSDVLLNPVFPQSEFDKLIKQTLTGIEADSENPDNITSNISGMVIYGKNHPYGEFVTEETVKAIELDDCKNYYNTYFKPNASILTIVGDITLAEAKELATKNLASWKKGTIKNNTYPAPTKPTSPQVTVVNKEGAVQSNILLGNTVNLKLGDPDYEAVKVLNEIYGSGFSGRLFQNLREDKEYTYGAYGGVSSNKLVGSFKSSAKVRNEVTDSAVEQFLLEINKIRLVEVSDDELQFAKNYIAGTFAQGLESPRTIGAFAARIDRYNLSKDYYKDYLKRINAVTKADVKRVAIKYMQPNQINIIVVGDAAAVGPKLAKFGTVTYRNKDGEVVEAPKEEKIDANVTAQSVIANYIKAIGGEEKLKAVKSISTVTGATMQGMAVSMTEKQLAPNRSYMKMEIPAMGMELMKQKFDGSKAKVTQQGQPVPLSEEDTKDMKITSYLFPELIYAEKEVKTELVGLKDVKGEKAYEIKVTLPSGTTFSEFYDKTTGYKVRKTESQEGPQGPVSMSTDYSDFKAVDGIVFPHTTEIPLGPGMNMKAKVETIKVNEKVDSSIFELK